MISRPHYLPDCAVAIHQTSQRKAVR